MIRSVCTWNSPLGGGPIGKDIVLSLGHCHSNQLPASAAVSNSSHCRNYWGAPLCYPDWCQCLQQQANSCGLYSHCVHSPSLPFHTPCNVSPTDFGGIPCPSYSLIKKNSKMDVINWQLKYHLCTTCFCMNCTCQNFQLLVGEEPYNFFTLALHVSRQL